MTHSAVPDGRPPRRRWTFRGAALFGLAALIACLTGYLLYTGIEGSNRLVHPPWRSTECRTPADLGWEYEAINYDSEAVASPPAQPVTGPTHCSAMAPAGDEVVTPDGIRIAGWYIPAAGDIGPGGPTIVMSHGHGGNKSGLLAYAEVVHDRYNVVLFDHRNAGQSTGTMTTLGVLEQHDLRVILDWLEREKGPERVGVLGTSMGAATALRVAASDQRLDAIAIDSAHARLSYTLEVRMEHAGHPPYPGTWAIFLGALVRTGLDFGAADPLDAVPQLGSRPLLILHGGADAANLVEVNAEPLRAVAQEAGVPVEVHVCGAAGHGGVLATCPDEYREWLNSFFDEALDGPRDAG